MATHNATIHIHATAQKVFDALTQPELVRLWQYGKALSTTWETGSRIIFSTEFDGKILKQWGTVLAFQPHEFLSYTLFTPKTGIEDKPENYQTTSYLLSEENSGTRIEIRQEDPVNNPLTDISLNPILATLKTTVELF